MTISEPATSTAAHIVEGSATLHGRTMSGHFDHGRGEPGVDVPGREHPLTYETMTTWVDAVRGRPPVT
jgi:hypothetical protein